MKTGYTYDAFISYRHTDLDKFVAENLHKQMEAFRLPRRIAKGKKDQRTRIERVFRDKDELPLTNNLEDPIRQALEQSEYLIVICSPRLRESLWCKKEIETFIELHGRHKILAVLAEGEPDESFPEELLCWKEEVKKPDGTVEIVEHRMEPLAADVRGKNKKAVIKAMKTEILRLLAPMFELSFDDLRQRHRERRMRRILGAAFAIAAVSIAFGAVSTAMALRINRQKEQIASQNEQISSQNEELVKKQEQIQEQNEMLLHDQALNLAQDAFDKLEDGDRVGALNTAISALTEYEGIGMPYTAKAQYALTEALHVYDHGRNLKPLYQMETRAMISFVKVSPEADRFLTCDQADGLVLWDVATGKRIKEFPDSEGNTEYSCAFAGNDRVAYLGDQSCPVIYDINTGEMTGNADARWSSALAASRDGKYVAVAASGKVQVLDASRPDVAVMEDEIPMGNLVRTMEFAAENSDLLIYSYRMDEEGYVRFLDIENGCLLSELAIGDFYVDETQSMGDTVWVLASCFEGETLEMDAALWAYEPRAGKTLWKQSFDRGGAALRRPHADGAEHLLVISGTESYLIRMDDGSVAWRDAVSDTVSGVFSLVGADSFLVFTRSGEYEQIVAPQMVSVARMGFFDCHSSNVKSVSAVKGGYLILEYLDNRVTRYGYTDVSDAEEIGQPSLPDMEKPVQYSEAKDFAKEKNLPKANLAQTVFYDEEGTVYFIYYMDGTLEIYGQSDGKLLAALDGIDDMLEYCFGRDKAGNLYVGSVSKGYMLSPEFELLAQIEGLQHIDPEGNYMVLKSASEMYKKVPIYTLEELLAKASDYVLKFE